MDEYKTISDEEFNRIMQSIARNKYAKFYADLERLGRLEFETISANQINAAYHKFGKRFHWKRYSPTRVIVYLDPVIELPLVPESEA